MADWTPPTQDRVEGYFKELNNWGRWGHDDQRGTANLITAAKRAQATLLVRTGRTVSLARDIGPQPAIMYNVSFPSNRERADVVLDRFDLVYHGFTITHIDALCHVAWDGELFNGRPFRDSLTAAGATWCAIDAYFDGLTTRGVLLDVAAGRKEGYVTVGQPVTPKELAAMSFSRNAPVVSRVVPGEGHRRDLMGHDGRASHQLSGVRHEHPPGDSVPGACARGQHEPGAAGQSVRGRGTLRVPLHGDADPVDGLNRRAGAPARDVLRPRRARIGLGVRPPARRAHAPTRRACGRSRRRFPASPGR